MYEENKILNNKKTSFQRGNEHEEEWKILNEKREEKNKEEETSFYTIIRVRYSFRYLKLIRTKDCWKKNRLMMILIQWYPNVDYSVAGITFIFPIRNEIQVDEKVALHWLHPLAIEWRPYSQHKITNQSQIKWIVMCMRGMERAQMQIAMLLLIKSNGHELFYFSYIFWVFVCI